MGLSPDEIRARIAAVDGWWHSIELAPGIVTPGGKPPEVLREELAGAAPHACSPSIPSCGASTSPRRVAYARRVPRPAFAAGLRRHPSAWRPDLLPGKRGFDTAREILGTRVESRVGDLRCRARVPREVAVIETQAMVLDGFENFALCEFDETDECNGDPTNWWSPNEKALVGMCRVAGFREAKLVVAKRREKLPRQREIQHRLTGEPLRQVRPPVPYRAIVHAWK
jgi:hypothetical protein